MSTLIVTMDPGAHKVGLCYGWLEDGKPRLVETLDVKTNLKGYARSSEVARRAEERLTLAWGEHRPLTRLLVVVEAMQADARTDSNTVKDILDCQATGAVFADRMVRYSQSLTTDEEVRLTVLSPTPSEWIKGMPKDVMKRQLMELWPTVISAKTGHDAISAAGLYRWALPFARFS